LFESSEISIGKRKRKMKMGIENSFMLNRKMGKYLFFK